MKKMLKTLLILSLLLTNFNLKGSFTYQIFESVPYYYSNFKTLSTKHFDIHYPSKSSDTSFIFKNMEELAKLVSIYAEDSYIFLSKDLKYTPFLKTQIVLIDKTDIHNGFATPIPQNTIYLYTVPPIVSSSMTEYRNWLKETLIHEMTHIISLSSTRGYSKFLKYIFGTIISTNGLWPLNLTEGIAVYNETKCSNHGRGRSSYIHTILRTKYNDQKLNTKDLKLSNTPYITDKWPLGSVPYLYGYLLFEHFDKYYSQTTPGKISKHNSGVIPFYPSYSVEEYTKKDIPEIWEDIIEEKQKLYKNWIKEIKKEKITKIKPILKSNQYYTNAISLSPEKNLIAYNSISPHHKSELHVYDIKRNKVIFKIEAYETSFITWINNKKLIYNTITTSPDKKFYKSFVLNLENKKTHEIKNSERIKYISKIDNNKVITVKIKTATNILNTEKLENNKLKKIETLYKTKLLGRISKPIFKNNNIIFLLKKTKTKYDKIISKNIKSKKTKTIYKTPNTIKDFQFYKKTLFVTESIDGIFNLYKKDFKTQHIKKKTNVISGIFEFELIDDKNSYVNFYTDKGFNLGKIKLSNNLKQNIFNKEQTEPVPIDIKQNKDIKAKKGSYSPLKTLVPKLWVPTASFSNDSYTLSALTYGGDSLFRHQYSLQGGYYSKTKKPIAYFSYINQSFYPKFSLDLEQDSNYYGLNKYSKEFTSKLTTRIPISGGNRIYWNLYFSYLYEYYCFDFNSTRYRKSGLSAAISYLNASSSYSSISEFEKGVYALAEYKIFPTLLGSTMKEYEANLKLKIYFPMYKNHILYFNNEASYSYGNRSSFFLAGNQMENIKFSYVKNFLIRGYPEDYFATKTLYISNIEYRFPIYTVNGFYNLFPLFFTKIHGAIVFDNAFLGKDFKNNFHSIGGELKFNMRLGYHMPSTFKLGVYKGTNYPNVRFAIGLSLYY
jgi:hypothetical protein